MEGFAYFPCQLWEGQTLGGGEGYGHLVHMLRNLKVTISKVTLAELTQPPLFSPAAETQERLLSSTVSVGNGGRTALDCMTDF